MHQTIEKNKGLLRFYCYAIRAIGWVLLLAASFLIIAILFCIIFNLGRGGILNKKPMGLFSLMIFGVLLLGMTEFLQCIIETKHKPSWTLRYGDKILYLYAVFLIGNKLWGSIHLMKEIEEKFHFDFLSFSIWALLAYLPSLLPFIAKILIIVGIGQVLRRIIMPIIEETGIRT